MAPHPERRSMYAVCIGIKNLEPFFRPIFGPKFMSIELTESDRVNLVTKCATQVGYLVRCTPLHPDLSYGDATRDFIDVINLQQ